MHDTRPSIPIRFVRHCPEPWAKFIEPVRKAREADISASISQLQVGEGLEYSQALSRARDMRWQQITRQSAKESSFALCMPIHDEEALLPSTLAAFASYFLPASVNATLVFFTNSCSDNSPNIVRSFLSTFGELKNAKVADAVSACDPLLDRECVYVQVGNLRFVHLNSRFPSKANAIRVANRLAHENGHPITISLDANNWLEPDTIALMYERAHATFFAQQDGTGLITGWTKVVQPFTANGPWQVIKRLLHPAPVVREAFGYGWLMCWPTSFVEKHGFPQTASEDYAFMAENIARGKKVVSLPHIAAWGFDIGSLKERISAQARSIRGVMQLARTCSDDIRQKIQELIEEKGFSPNFMGRLRHLVKAIVRAPMRLPIKLCGFVISEYANRIARRDFANNPQSSTWEPLRHSKGAALLGQSSK